jgi:hypothetical protein
MTIGDLVTVYHRGRPLGIITGVRYGKTDNTRVTVYTVFVNGEYHRVLPWQMEATNA